MIRDNNISIPKIPLLRLIKLNLEFKYNYKNEARRIYNGLDLETREQLLNSEFESDKDLNYSDKHNKRILPKLKRDYGTYDFRYATHINQLKADGFHQIHIRHNLYRTISASLLENCTIDEKAYILALNVKHCNLIIRDIYPTSLYNLIYLEDCLNIQQTEQQTNIK
ncbi:MAG: hypothetical protein ACLRFE_02410 [Clostridia bacterium]